MIYSVKLILVKKRDDQNIKPDKDDAYASEL